MKTDGWSQHRSTPVADIPRERERERGEGWRDGGREGGREGGGERERLGYSSYCIYFYVAYSDIHAFKYLCTRSRLFEH